MSRGLFRAVPTARSWRKGALPALTLLPAAYSIAVTWPSPLPDRGIPAAISSTLAVRLEPYRASSVNDRLYVSGIQKDTNSTVTDTPAM